MGPGKEVLKNRGQRKVRLRLGEESGPIAGVRFQDAEVRRPILAVSESEEAGNSLWFDREGSFLLPKDCPEQAKIRRLVQQAKRKLQMKKEKGVFKLDAWVEPPAGPFGR